MLFLYWMPFQTEKDYWRFTQNYKEFRLHQYKCIISVEFLQYFKVFASLTSIASVYTSLPDQTISAMFYMLLQYPKCFAGYYNITNARGKVARFCLFKQAFRIGDDIVGTCDFTDSSIPCAQVCVLSVNYVSVSSLYVCMWMNLYAHFAISGIAQERMNGYWRG